MKVFKNGGVRSREVWKREAEEIAGWKLSGIEVVLADKSSSHVPDYCEVSGGERTSEYFEM